MFQVTFQPIVIMALNRASIALDVALLHEAGFSDYIQAKGSYKGVQEASYIIPIRGARDLDRLLALAANTGQESILVSRNDRTSYLIYVNGGEETELGVLKPWFRSELPDAYTAIGNNVWAIEGGVS